MSSYFKKLFVRFEMMAHPASGWFRNNADALQKGKSKNTESSGVIPPSPDSFNVRGTWDKKNNNPRYTPAP